MNTKLYLLLVGLFVFILAACAPQARATPAVKPQSGETITEAATAPHPPDAKAEAAYPAAGGGAPQAEMAALSLPYASSRMVIKDAQIDLLIDDTDRAMDQITQYAAGRGGYVISSQVIYRGEAKFATLKLGIPSAAFEETLAYLRNFALKVLKETASGQDVSAEYNDLQTRLINLEATSARVRAFLDDAKTVEESLRINATLSELEGEIEQIKGQMKFYETRSAFSTVTVNLEPETPTPTITPSPTPTPTPTPTPRWNPAETFQDASKVLEQVTRATVDLLIWVVILLGPMAAVITIVVLAVLAIRRRVQPLFKPAPPPPAAAPKPEEHD